jgi:hypothetical protein
MEPNILSEWFRWSIDRLLTGVVPESSSLGTMKSSLPLDVLIVLDLEMRQVPADPVDGACRKCRGTRCPPLEGLSIRTRTAGDRLVGKELASDVWNQGNGG